jgi:purine-binding chemotaxis protein CheW
MSTTSRYSTFSLAGDLYGVEVERVQEVLKHQPMTPVPLAPPSVAGLVNLRGQVSTAIDMRRRLDLPLRGEDDLPMNVVVRTDDGLVSLLVDRIGDVVDADESTFEPAQDAMTGPARQLVRGTYDLGEKLLLALDVDQTVDVNSRQNVGAGDRGGSTSTTGRGGTRPGTPDTSRT